MAIIKCPECGHEISSKAIACPHCGNPISTELVSATECDKIAAQDMGYFRIERYHHLRNQKRIFKVYIDGKSIGRFEDDSYLECEIPYGLHKIKIVDKEDGSIVCKDHFRQAEEDVIAQYDAVDGTISFDDDDDDDTVICPRCGGRMSVQAVVEDIRTGCMTILFYILLAITIFGILIIIVLNLRKRNETVTYAVCQKCGYRMRI